MVRWGKEKGNTTEGVTTFNSSCLLTQLTRKENSLQETLSSSLRQKWF